MRNEIGNTPVFSKDRNFACVINFHAQSAETRVIYFLALRRERNCPFEGA
jgi:hypothetical protein